MGSFQVAWDHWEKTKIEAQEGVKIGYFEVAVERKQVCQEEIVAVALVYLVYSEVHLEIIN